MKRTIGILTISALSTLAQADVSSQVVSFDAGFDGAFISFEKFDTMGGTRELTGLSLSYDQTISLDIQMQSNGYTAISAGDWLLSTGFMSLHQFGLAEGRGGDGTPGPPFIGPGAVYDTLTSDLGISDGYNNGGIDTQQFNISESFVFDASYDGSTEFDQRMFDAFTGTGTLDTFLGGFIEGFFEWVNDPNWVVDPTDPPDGPFGGPFGGDPYYGLFADYLALSHAGDITVTYEYTTIPAPAGAGVLALAGLISTRRRR
tara:strand:- start:79369 stop:80145 length:777 start_codon:yes stop_codon:yes gene_type:complete